jgi:hypothetical protein
MAFKTSTSKPKEKQKLYMLMGIERARAYLKNKDFSARGHNYSWEIDEKGKSSFTLGNMTDAGWFWSGKEDEIVGFLVRLQSSTEKQNFLNDVKKLNFVQIKSLLYTSSKAKDGLYELSGDNRRWHFGETEDESYIEDEMDENDFTEEQKDKVWNEYKSITYEQFEKKYGNQYRIDIDTAIYNSKSFEEFMSKTEKLGEKYNEKARNENTERAGEIINKIRRQKK